MTKKAMQLHVLIKVILLLPLTFMIVGCSTTSPSAEYYKGRTAERNNNYAKAKSHYEKAATGGSTSALMALGDVYLYGEGKASKDITKGLSFYQKAVDKGSCYASKSLAEIHMGGDLSEKIGIKKNYIKSLEYLKKTEKLNIDGCSMADGDIYLNNARIAVWKILGWGEYSNEEQGLNKLRSDAAKGNYDSMTYLGMYYSAGYPDFISIKYRDIDKTLYWFEEALKATPKRDTSEMKSTFRLLDNLNSVRATELIAKYEHIMQQEAQLAALENKAKEKQEQLAALQKQQREREEKIQSARRAEERHEAEAEREKRRQGQADAIALLSSIYATHKGDAGLANAAADLSRDKGSGKYSQQLSDSARQTSEYDRQKLEAQQKRERQTSARKEAQLKKELAALKREQKQHADLQQIRAAVQRKQLSDQSTPQQQAQIQQLQQAQRDEAEKQRQLRIKAAQRRKQQQLLEQQRQQRLAQASQQQAQVAAVAAPQVSYQNCIGGAESNPRVRNESVGSEAYIKNTCDGPIDFVLCTRDNRENSVNIYNPSATGWLRPGESRWVNIALLKVHEMDAGFSWCGPAEYCSMPRSGVGNC